MKSSRSVTFEQFKKLSNPSVQEESFNVGEQLTNVILSNAHNLIRNKEIDKSVRPFTTQRILNIEKSALAYHRIPDSFHKASAKPTEPLAANYDRIKTTQREHVIGKRSLRNGASRLANSTVDIMKKNVLMNPLRK